MAKKEYRMNLNLFEKLLVDRNIKTNIELSELCDIDRNTIGRIRNGEILPSAQVMYKLATGLKMTPEQAGIIFFSVYLRTA